MGRFRHEVRSLGRRTGGGFTLIELMVTISVLAILMMLAVPSFTSIINSNRLTAQSNEVVAALQLARMEAIKQNRRAIVCRSATGTTCANAPGAWRSEERREGKAWVSTWRSRGWR